MHCVLGITTTLSDPVPVFVIPQGMFTPITTWHLLAQGYQSGEKEKRKLKCLPIILRASAGGSSASALHAVLESCGRG